MSRSHLMPKRMPPLPTIKDVLRLYGIRAKRSLSQNFILDPKILDKFAKSSPNAPLKGKYAVEVGPGPGGITRALIANGAREVHVIEKDHRFLPTLRLLQECSGDILHINHGDCLHYNLSKVFPEELRRPWLDQDLPNICLFGNLPFNIATPFLIRLLRAMAFKDNIYAYGRVPALLTFQEEVGDRMVAPPTADIRSRISALTQNYAQTRIKYVLKGGAFQPKPKVNVAVVELTPLKVPYIDLPFTFVEKVITAVYRHKKKLLKNTVKYLFPEDVHQMRNVYTLLDLIDMDYSKRPIDLTMDDLEKICYGYKEFTDRDPDIANYFHSDIKKLTLAYQEALHFERDGVEQDRVYLFEDDDPLADLQLDDDLDQRELL